MKNSWYKKGLVVGIICLLFLLSPVIPAYSIQARNNKTITRNQNDDLPDLVIDNVYYEYWMWDEYGDFGVTILNDGDGEIPHGPYYKTVNVYYNYLLIPFVQGHYITEWRSGYCLPTPPGEKTEFRADDFFTRGFYDAVVYIGFWVNSRKKILESDYENNGVWGLFKVEARYNWIECNLIGDLHQWKTDGNPPPWWPSVEYIEDNHFSQTTQQQTTQQTIVGNFLNKLIRR
jgi:hypothetical protein